MSGSKACIITTCSVSDNSLFVTCVSAPKAKTALPYAACRQWLNAWCFYLFSKVIKPRWLLESKKDLLHLPTRMGKASHCWKVLPIVTVTNTHLHAIQTLNTNPKPCSSRWCTTLSSPMHSCPVMQDSKPSRAQCQMAALAMQTFYF